ncbi:MAG: pyruvate kinase [Verrucomicrobia bacterium]|nr:pyruvate kinase [Verrucomicrobiota bacterium]
MPEISKRKTKIVATLGPATELPEVLHQLIVAGANVLRLNMSHAPHDWVREMVAHIRSVARACKAQVGILLDTQGPAIRTGDLPVPLDLQPGQKFTLTVRGEHSEEEQSVDVNYENFVNDISVGDVVLIDNGAIQMKVLAKSGHRVECEVMTEGKLGSRRHINLPGVKVSLPALTAKDIKDIQLGLELQVDYIALSFVREARDLLQLKELFHGSPHRPVVIAKIEDHQAVENLEEIVREADGIMAARGDLGIEIPYEELPIVQRRIVKACLRVGKPVIVATHMLESMIQSPMPTRAEVTDVANAVYEQADAIMLSGETTVGKYPVKCIEVFDRIARRIERSGGAGYFKDAELTSPRQKLAKSAVVMANELRAEAMVVVTRKGHLARYTSWMRPQYSKIIGVCESDTVARSLSLHWGVIPVVSRFHESRPEETIRAAFRMLVEQGQLHAGNTVVVIGSISAGDEIVDAVQMRIVE